MRSWPTAASFVLALCLAACGNADRQEAGQVPAPSDAVFSSAEQPDVIPGAEVLARRGFDLLEGRRVGLIVNHTALVGSDHLIDLVAGAPGVELTALFGPEHGLRGEADAGETVEDGLDARTGTPIYSLYGQTRAPTSSMLSDVDVLVFDIQDVGARFYTYISTMGLAMQAAAEHDISFIVLDRPNPLGGEYVSGFVLEPGLESFVGQYPIPMAHGLSVGELALMIQAEGMLEGVADLDLEVVETDGWKRSMRWPATNLTWIAPSPNVPDFETALVYPGAVLFEATSASEGRGTRAPFKQVGAPWADGEALAALLNARGLEGVHFEPAEFVPESIEGMASHPKLQGTQVNGVRYVIDDVQTFRPVETGIHVLQAFYRQAVERGVDDLISRDEWLARLAGTERLLEMLRADVSPEDIIASWEDDVDLFTARRADYLIY